MKDINIVFVNYNTEADLRRALESLTADISAGPNDVQINVVDNSQNQAGLRELLADSFSRVKYINPGANVGFAKGNNLGFQATPARYYFALNPDTIIPPQARTIERIIAFMDRHPKIGCIAPKLVNVDGSAQASCYRFNVAALASKPLRQLRWEERWRGLRRHTDWLLMKEFDHNETRPVDWVLGAAMVVRKEVADKIGWFDERFFMYLEDCDWCRRMWEAGWPVYYAHDIEIQHYHARESAKVPGVFKALWKNKLARTHLFSWCKYLWKWRGRHRYYGKLK